MANSKSALDTFALDATTAVNLVLDGSALSAIATVDPGLGTFTSSVVAAINSVLSVDAFALSTIVTVVDSVLPADNFPSRGVTAVNSGLDAFASNAVAVMANGGMNLF